MYFTERAHAQRLGAGANEEAIRGGVHVDSYHFAAVDCEVACRTKQRMDLGCGAPDSDSIE